MDSSNDADREPEPDTTKKMKSDDSRSEDAEEDLQMTPGDKLCEDELALIFSNSWISTQDLFNLRLVSKSWRDAATATLLRRDACVVQLYGDSNQDPPCFFKHRGNKMDKNKLGQLTNLISNSPKFPSTNFRIRTSLYTFASYTDFPDLLHFFKLHGHKIKTLRPYGWLSHKCLLDIFFIYSPTLEHLDLSKAEIGLLNQWVDEDEEEEIVDSKWTSKAFPFKSLILKEFAFCPITLAAHNQGNDPDTNENDHCYYCNNATDRQLLHLLLSSSSKLSSIENVTLKTLRTVLKEGKGHLIRSFKYKLEETFPCTVSQLTKFMALSPKLNLSTLILDLEWDWYQRDTFVYSWNGLIESFQDTVENLSISFCYYDFTWSPRLRIPPMKKLKSLTLTLLTWWDFICKGHGNYQCRMCHVDHTAIANFREMVFQFQDGISAQHYFPELMEVSLNSNGISFTDAGFMSFFSFKSDADAGGSPASWDRLPKVDILKIRSRGIGTNKSDEACEYSTAIETPLVTETFPNITILKLRCGKVWRLSDDLWTLCPNVELVEIYCINSYSSRDRGEVEMSQSVDRFFTGLSDRMVEYLRRLAAGLPCGSAEFGKLKFEVKRPSIFDVPRLRELKLMFVGKWSTEFASSVTGLHAFSKLENTKLIISYDPGACVSGLNMDWNVNCRNNIVGNFGEGNDSEKNDDHKIAKYEELIFGPIKTYVNIVHEKQKWD